VLCIAFKKRRRGRSGHGESRRRGEGKGAKGREKQLWGLDSLKKENTGSGHPHASQHNCGGEKARRTSKNPGGPVITEVCLGGENRKNKKRRFQLSWVKECSGNATCICRGWHGGEI